MLWFCGHLLCFAAPVVGAAAQTISYRRFISISPISSRRPMWAVIVHLAHGTNTPVTALDRIAHMT